MKSTLTVIIPTLNNTSGLKYLLNYFKDKPYQLVVIDNKPSRKKQELVRKFETFKVLKYIPQNKNLGFAVAVNLGVKYAKTQWLLILNDDVEFKDDQSINRLYIYAQKRYLDAVSPILVNPNGIIENCGYKILPYGKVELFKNVNGLTSLRVNDLDGLTAACLLIKTDVFTKLGGFDESFFAYLEDVEFFLRLPRRNVRVAQDKPFGIAYDIEVFHNHMTTAKTMGSFKVRQDMINWWRLYFKHKDKFKFDSKFIIERLRNLFGLLKYYLKYD
jgi:GT2 family glycosyltransferase